eukprot:1313670-Alexandrium_andersonii.AAC.1
MRDSFLDSLEAARIKVAAVQETRGVSASGAPGALMGLRRRDRGGVLAAARPGVLGKVGVAVVAQEPAVVVSPRTVERGGG